MADDTAKQQLDSIVSAIGFGIVSDFRDLRDAMGGFSSQVQESNRLIDQVTVETNNTSKSLDQFQKDTYRRRDDRQFKRLESQMEKRAQLTGQRGDESMKRVAAAIEGLQKKMSMGAGAPDGGDVDEDSIINRVLGALGGAGTTALEVGAGAAGLGLAGQLLKGGLVAGGAAALGVGAYAAYSYLSSDEASAAPAEQAQPNLAATPPPTTPQQSSYSAPPAQTTPPAPSATPASAPQVTPAPVTPSPSQQLRPAATASGSVGAPTVASDMVKMGAGAASVGASVVAVKGVIDLAQKTARQKALSKIAARVPSYLSKFGGRIVGTIGAKSVPVFGALVGGYFAFNRFMSGDSWTAIGSEFVSGVAPDLGGVAAGPAGYVAGVATTLAIQTYLITRDIYNEENAIDIRNGVVPNFDDLDAVEKSQVVKEVGGYVQNYVNSLIGRSSTADSTTGVTQTSTSGSSSTAAAASTAGGVTTQVAHDIATDRANPQAQTQMPGGGQPKPTFDGFTPQDTSTPPGPTSMPGGGEPSATFAPPGSGQQQNNLAPSGAATEQSEQQSSSPSDTMASISTSSNQAGSMYSKGDYGPILDYLADSEGSDYDTQYGYQNTTDGKKLTEMTVAEVMQAQSKQKGSSAIGRYQFMRQTLNDGISQGIISPDEQFSPEMQDRLATWLIDSKRKGSSWRAGKMSDEDFGRALSQEWASVPNPYTGKSYYGQGIKYGSDTLLEVIKSAKMPPAKPMAEGGKVTPLTADKPKAGRDPSLELKPIKATYDDRDEETMSSSSMPIDKRPRTVSAPDPVENRRNKISTYMPVMQHIFGSLSEEIASHMNGEVSADKAFKDAMNPIG